MLNHYETEQVLKAIDMAIISYKRSQKQRPEFSEIAKRLEEDLSRIKIKIAALPQGENPTVSTSVTKK